MLADILIIGAGAAGLAAAIAADKRGLRVVLAEQSAAPGGVLNQCIHLGFGLSYFRENLSGRDYAARFSEKLMNSRVICMYNTTVLEVRPDRSAVLLSENGLIIVRFKTCILSTGCYEKSVYSLLLSGTRPSGVMTAGQLQRMMNCDGIVPVGHFVILGTGDIGQIIARQLFLAGQTSVIMIEKNSFPGGMVRNRRECIEAFNIPVLCRSTVSALNGYPSLHSVTVKNLDNGELEEYPCDFLVSAIGLLPNRDCIKKLSLDGELPNWMYLCGNCDYVHSIVDSVTEQAEKLVLQLFIE